MVGCVEGIGMRPDIEGLRIAPSVPKIGMNSQFRKILEENI